MKRLLCILTILALCVTGATGCTKRKNEATIPSVLIPIPTDLKVGSGGGGTPKQASPEKEAGKAGEPKEKPSNPVPKP